MINQYIDSVTLDQLAQDLPPLDVPAKDSCCGCTAKTKNHAKVLDISASVLYNKQALSGVQHHIGV